MRAKTLRLAEGAHARGRFFADRIAVVEGALLEGGVNTSEPPFDAGGEMSSSGLGVDVDEIIPAEPGPEPAAVT